MGLSMCRKRLDYMHVCGELEMFVSVERVVRVWREPTAHRYMHGELSVLCMKVLRMSREFWRESGMWYVCGGRKGFVCMFVCRDKGVCGGREWGCGKRARSLWKERE